MRALVEAAVHREMAEADAAPAEPYQHRIPIGLMLLSKGWITSEQLQDALASRGTAEGAQAAARLGNWLVERGGLEEELLTRALSLQWNCPVFSARDHHPQTMTAYLPRLILDMFGILPLRVTRGRVLYIAMEDRIDPCVALALERMTGLRVEAGVAVGSEFRSAHARMLQARFPRVRLLEASSASAAAAALTDQIEAGKAADARLVRLHQYLWLRLFKQRAELPQVDTVEDMLCWFPE